LERKELLDGVTLSSPLTLVSYKLVKTKAEMLHALRLAFAHRGSEGAMLKDVNAQSAQKRNADWAKVKTIIKRVAKVLDKHQVSGKNMWTYELGFLDKNREIYSPGTSMGTSIDVKVGEHVVVALPSSGIWETPMIRGTTTEELSALPLRESGTPDWESCEAWEKELEGMGLGSCGRLSTIGENLDWVVRNGRYPGERKYAEEIKKTVSTMSKDHCEFEGELLGMGAELNETPTCARLESIGSRANEIYDYTWIEGQQTIATAINRIAGIIYGNRCQ